MDGHNFKSYLSAYNIAVLAFFAWENVWVKRKDLTGKILKKKILKKTELISQFKLDKLNLRVEVNLGKLLFPACLIAFKF